MGQVGIFEVKSPRFQTRKRRLDSPTLSIECQHLLEVGSVGNQQDALAVGRAVTHQIQRQAVIEGRVWIVSGGASGHPFIKSSPISLPAIVERKRCICRVGE